MCRINSNLLPWPLKVFYLSQIFLSTSHPGKAAINPHVCWSPLTQPPSSCHTLSSPLPLLSGLPNLVCPASFFPLSLSQTSGPSLGSSFSLRGWKGNSPPCLSHLPSVCYYTTLLPYICLFMCLSPQRQFVLSIELWSWRRLLRIPWTARRSNQSILKEINPEYSLEGLMLKLKLQWFSHLMRRANSLEKTLLLGKV